MGSEMCIRDSSQVVSHEATIAVEGIEGPPLDVLFIRAPVVTRVGPGVRVIATLEDGSVVGVATETLLGVAFHPEVSGDNRLHKMFLHDMVISRVSPPARR